MKSLTDHVIRTLQPATRMPDFRVLPYSAETQTKTREKVSAAIAEGNARVWHLKRLLWHPTQHESCMNYSMQLGEDCFISIKCNSSFGVLMGCCGDSFEVYDKESGARTYYEDFKNFLADGWVLD